MRFFVHIVLFLFFAFLAAPTIVSLLEDEDTRASMVYSASDEEIQKDIKEVKAITHSVYEIAFTPNFKRSSLIRSKNEELHNTVCCDIFLPPPEFI